MAAEPIAIVGMAVVMPGARDLDAYWRNIAGGIDAIADAPPDRLDPVYFGSEPAPDRFYCTRGGFVPAGLTFDPVRFGVMPSAVDAIEPDQLVALQVAAAAVDDAGGVDRLPDRDRVGVVLGHGGYINAGAARLDQRVRTAQQLTEALRALVPGLSAAELASVKAEFTDRLGPAQPQSAIDVVPNLVASRIANRLDFHGPAYAVDAACASSLVALDHAVRELEAHRCDVMLAGGVHHAHDVTFWSVFHQLRAVSPSGVSRPFDRKADGLLIGEGTGVVVLKRLADAEAAGDRIYAVVKGVGVSSDGRGGTAMSPAVDGQRLALRRAWDDARLDPATIGLLEAHGTATPVGDAAELDSMRFFGADRTAGAVVGSVKSMIGHAMPAAGVAGLVKAALALHHSRLVPTLHCDEPRPELMHTRFRVLAEAEEWPNGSKPRRAGVNAFGFGGINAHVVLEEHAPSRRRRNGRSRPEQALLLTAASVDELQARLRDHLAGEAAVPVGSGPVRLAVLEPTADRLERAARIVAKARPWRGRAGMWFVPDGLLAGGGKLAFLFPGVEPVFDPSIDDLVEEFGGRSAMPDAGTLEGLGRAIFATGRLIDRALRNLGISPDVVAGHSLGEWNGLVASEMVPSADFERFNESVHQGFLETPGVSYLAVSAPVSFVAGMIEDLPLVTISHDNCPHQSVVCGDPDQIAELTERLRAARKLSQPLPFQSGFHSPWFDPYLDTMRPHAARLPLQRSAVPLWSATTCEPYPDDPDEVRRLLLRHLVEPVRFRELITRLYADAGARVFLQVGTGSLPGFVDDTLAGDAHMAMAANDPKRSGRDQLRRVALAVWAEGGSVDLDAAGVDPTNRSGVPLRLSSLLVSLDGVEPLRPRAPAPVPVPAAPPGHPVLAEFATLVAEMGEAAAQVVDAWAAGGGAPPAEPMAVRQRVKLSLATHPFLADHAVFDQAAGWPDPEDRFPIVPMTMMIGLMKEAAAAAAPDRVITAVEDVRALRWLLVEPPVEVAVEAKPVAPDAVRVRLEGYASATVRFGAELPARRANPGPLPGEHPSPVDAAALYRDRWMFHGPRYSGVREILGIGPEGVRGRIEALPAPDALLDNAGQLMGFWVMASMDRDRYALPARIDRISYHADEPAAGSMVDCRIQVVDVSEREVRTRMELAHGGRVWALVEGWVDRRFASDEIVYPIWVAAGTHTLAEPRPGGWVLVRDRWQDSASRELIMRRYTNRREREQYAQLNPRAQRTWLLGRIAVKDAVRRWMWEKGAGPVFPAQISVSNDGSGRPVAAGPFDADLRVSLAHTGELAVAMVAEGRDVGIDAERVDVRPDGFAASFSDVAERELGAGDADEEWLTRLWAAKEAVAKAGGAGLRGRPRDLVVTARDGDRLTVSGRMVATTKEEDGDVVIAWTLA